MDENLRRLINLADSINAKVTQLERKVEDLYRETRTTTGVELGRQFTDFLRQYNQDSRKITQIERDVTAIRRTVEFGDQNLKDIKQALAMIYRNTDDLEPKLLGTQGA